MWVCGFLWLKMLSHLSDPAVKTHNLSRSRRQRIESWISRDTEILERNPWELDKNLSTNSVQSTNDSKIMHMWESPGKQSSDRRESMFEKSNCSVSLLLFSLIFPMFRVAQPADRWSLADFKACVISKKY